MEKIFFGSLFINSTIRNFAYAFLIGEAREYPESILLNDVVFWFGYHELDVLPMGNFHILWEFLLKRTLDHTKAPVLHLQWRLWINPELDGQTNPSDPFQPNC